MMKSRVKIGMVCHGIRPMELITIDELEQNFTLKAGDVGLFMVTEIGKNKMIQTVSRSATLIPGDLVMGAFGNRYATNQFEGYIPDDLKGEFHMLGGAGVIGQVKSMHQRLDEIGPTKVELVGLYTDERGQIANTISRKEQKLIPFTGDLAKRTKVVLSLGSSMDSGKTTTAAFLINGLVKKGHTAAYIKLTGTAYPKDANLVFDLGACEAIDFSRYGYPSTYLVSEEKLLNLYESLLRDVLKKRPDYVVIEIADGILQRETKMLLKNSKFMRSVHQVVFSAGDSLSAVNGFYTLNSWGIQATALAGLFTASPLLVQEVRECLDENNDHSYLPILNLEQLSMGEFPAYLRPNQLLSA
ncbi:hypothetical protein [Cyclobacterium xiamenense]|uniref:hypothetical protein n=1 Tax=Cyclobacterium xiamenense TaxID=1297121 RepID=UPI0035D1090A